LGPFRISQGRLHPRPAQRHIFLALSEVEGQKAAAILRGRNFFP
jgi:hypothetical protein